MKPAPANDVMLCLEAEPRVEVDEHCAQGNVRQARPSWWARAAARTSFIIASVNRPVNVFCWLGW